MHERYDSAEAVIVTLTKTSLEGSIPVFRRHGGWKIAGSHHILGSRSDDDI